jgi:Domain of unknown function (DUF1835)
MKTLHIVDGDSTGGGLKRALSARAHDILSWRDALYSGPVPDGLTLHRLSQVRSKFWTNGKRTNGFDKRDTQLRRYREYDEIVLWFGSNCTLCHLSLAQLLSWFDEQKVRPRALSWVSRHGGVLNPEQMQKAYARRRSVERSQLKQASHLWRAFRSSSPTALERQLRSRQPSLPGRLKAVERMLQEYPGRRGGLSRLEARLLNVIKSTREMQAVWVVTTVLRTETVADLLLLDMLRSLLTAPHPLLSYAAPFTGSVRSYKFNGAKLTLTNTGRRVLAGKDDHVALNGVDRWIGGVHLQGHKIRWRWDEQIRKIISER